ncbi:uncharacterized protein [Chelonus insularis]|uniref:uncharacterized protein n=1 Tax=Chelonus insularis TaxID=460826 RepID=UPI00158831C2|nr:uncharacterized protein LOC118074758 [Chelonus insularis]
MNNTEKVLILLCKQIHLCTNVIITIDDLNSLKSSNATLDTVENFWTILNILSQHAVQEKNSTVNFNIYDKVTATKLYFGYLKYSDIEFFSLSANNNKNSVLLLIAFSWLLVRHNVIDSLIKDKIVKQTFNDELISKNNHPVYEQNDSKIQNNQSPSDKINESNVIIRKMMQINYNLKDITELINEKCRLLKKIHCETSNIFNLSHLSLSELILMKNYYKINRKYCKADLQYIEKLNNTTLLIDLYEKWSKNNHIFLKWMINIIEECKSKSTIAIDNEELFKYISTVRYLNGNKIYSLETNNIINNNIFNNLILSNSCQTSRIKSFTKQLNPKIFQELTKTQIELSKKIERIDTSMQTIINSVPHCIQI